METNPRYTARDALADVATTRARTTEVANFPVPAWAYLPTAAVFPFSGLGFVLDSPWSYVVIGLAILVAAAVTWYIAVLTERHGVQMKLHVHPRRHPGTYAATLGSALAFGATLPLTDILGWSPWVVPAAGLACGLIWAVALIRLDRVSSMPDAGGAAARLGGSR